MAETDLFLAEYGSRALESQRMEKQTGRIAPRLDSIRKALPVEMEYRHLGRSGLEVSALSFGSWVTFDNQLDVGKAEECMALAYEHGVNFFDNAEAYAAGESERIMGQALKKLNWSRDSYCVSSKVFWGGKKPTQRRLHRKHVFDACHAALQRLQVDYLDLYFCHRPDPRTPIEETVRAMHHLIQQGKVMYWGTSEWSAVQIMEAHAVAGVHHLTPPTMEQPQYNMLTRDRVEAEYRHVYRSVGLGTTIWSPLASGILTNKYAEGIPSGSRLDLEGFEWLRDRFTDEEGKRKIEKTRKVAAIAAELGTTSAKLAIAWCLKNPNVSTVILGASRTSQLEENLGALEVLPMLTDEVMENLEAALDNKPADEMEF